MSTSGVYYNVRDYNKQEIIKNHQELIRALGGVKNEKNMDY
jgi:hypothetical protein